MKSASTLTLLLLTAACIDPLSIQVRPAENRLVVDGLITDREGPYQVKLYYSHNLATTLLHVSYELARNATIVIVDDEDNTYPLAEVNPGIYETDPNNLRGEVGRSYSIKIKTEDGREFESSAQRLLPSGEINNVTFKFEKDALPGEFSQTHIDALRVFVDAKGNGSGGQNLFRWRWTTTFKAKTYPELREETTRAGQRPYPDPCSGVVYLGPVRGLERIGPCMCCVCWSYGYSPYARVSKVDLVSENVFSGLDLGIIPVSFMQFYDKYYIEVEQLSLSPEAYDFWNLVEKQQIGEKDIFQPSSIKVKGNIVCLSNPEEEVLGFFGVSGVVSSAQFINPDIIPDEIPPFDVVKYSCLEYYSNTTALEPWFW